MAERSTRKKVTFTRPFFLKGLEGVQREGVYVIETREVLGGLLSWFRVTRTSTWIRTHRTPGTVGAIRSVSIEPADLAALLERDARSGPA